MGCIQFNPVEFAAITCTINQEKYLDKNRQKLHPLPSCVTEELDKVNSAVGKQLIGYET